VNTNLIGVYALIYTATDLSSNSSSSTRTVSVTEMTNMFYQTESFNLDLGSWDIAQVSFMRDMFNGVTLSTTNYNNLLTNWSNQNVRDDMLFSGGSWQYSGTAAENARSKLINNFNWTISDGGEVP